MSIWIIFFKLQQNQTVISELWVVRHYWMFTLSKPINNVIFYIFTFPLYWKLEQRSSEIVSLKNMIPFLIILQHVIAHIAALALPRVSILCTITVSDGASSEHCHTWMEVGQVGLISWTTVKEEWSSDGCWQRTDSEVLFFFSTVLCIFQCNLIVVELSNHVEWDLKKEMTRFK